MRRTMRLLAAALAMVMALAGLPMYGMEVKAEGDDYLVSGNYQYKVNEDGDSVTIMRYTGNGGDVTIPTEIDGKKVTDIGNNAFARVGKLTGITIPDGVTSIGSSAFYYCVSLASIRIPDSVTSIRNNAFLGCSGLTGIEVSGGNTAYDSRDNSQAIIETESNTLILGGKNTVIPDSVESIGGGAFAYRSVNGITIPDSVKKIGSNAFSHTDITGIVIPSGVESIGYGIFIGCQSLESIEVHEKNAVYDSRGNCNAIIEKETNTLISGCKNTVIPAGIESIGEGAFSHIEFTNIVLPESLTSIGENAFRYCELLSITIPASVTSIGEGAFESSSTSPSNKTIIYGNSGSAAETYAKENDMLFNPPEYLYEPDFLSFEEGVVILRYTRNDKDIIIPSEIDGKKVIRIEQGVFARYSDIVNISILADIDKVDNFTFTKCSSLEHVSLPDSITSIHQGAFSDCSSLKDIKIPDRVTYISIDAFINCGSLTSITIPAGVTSIGTHAFGYSVSGYYSGYYEEESKYKKNPDFVIYGYGGTEAERYAKENGFTFESLGSVQDISKAAITLAETSYTYDGQAKTPSVTVKMGGKTLVLNTDYTVNYGNNINPGTAKVIVTGKGNYTGSTSVDFTIVKAAEEPNSSITCNKTLYKVTYGAKPFKINAASGSKLTFTSSSTKVASVDKNTGKVTIKNTGVATITVKAGTKSVKVTVKVSPKKQTVKSAKAVKGKKLTVGWAKDKTASGYQVQISTARNFKKDVKSKNVSKTSYTFTKLKTGKKYYVRVRSYKKWGKDMLFGDWSKVKQSGKIKK